MALFNHNFNIGVPSFRRRVFNPIFVNSDTLNLLDTLIPSFQSRGWNRNMPIEFTINIASGIYVGSSTATRPALDFTTFHRFSKISIINNGFILGAGGNGGPSSWWNTSLGGSIGLGPQSGGIALRTSCPLVITNNGVIGGGGGGGYGGGIVVFNSVVVAGGGGGGGAGYTPGLGGTSSVTPTSNGTIGQRNSGGNGGSRTFTTNNLYCGDNGGIGGGLGSAGGIVSGMLRGTLPSLAGGAAGTSGYIEGGGTVLDGRGGASIVGNSFITWIATGTRTGLIS
jgi:hypothetical protein